MLSKPTTNRAGGSETPSARNGTNTLPNNTTTRRRDSASSMYANPDTDPDYQKDPVVEDPKASQKREQTATGTKNSGK